MSCACLKSIIVIVVLSLVYRAKCDIFELFADNVISTALNPIYNPAYTAVDVVSKGAQSAALSAGLGPSGSN